MKFSKLSFHVLGVLAVMATQSLALAQDFPTKQISLFLGSAAGSNPDTMSRYLAQYLQTSLGQTVIVENKPGAFGNLAGEAVAKARPDGHSILIAPNITYAVA